MALWPSVNVMAQILRANLRTLSQGYANSDHDSRFHSTSICCRCRLNAMRMYRCDYEKEIPTCCVTKLNSLCENPWRRRRRPSLKMIQSVSFVRIKKASWEFVHFIMMSRYDEVNELHQLNRQCRQIRANWLLSRRYVGRCSLFARCSVVVVAVVVTNVN